MTTLTVGGVVIQLADWVSDRCYNTVDCGVYPQITGDPRRWPDCMFALLKFTSGEAGDSHPLQLDADLAAVVHGALINGVPDATTAWAIANTVDAAVDEQDRRDGKPWRGPRLESAPIKAFFVTRTQPKAPAPKSRQRRARRRRRR